MDQPIPSVTEKDFRRLVIRYFGEKKLPLVMDILQEYCDRDEVGLGNPRIQIAILKLADGDLDELSNNRRQSHDRTQEMSYPWQNIRDMRAR